MSFTRSEKAKLLLISPLAYLILSLLRLTIRCSLMRVPGNVPVQGDWRFEEPCLFVFWHNRQIALPWFFRKLRGKIQKPLSVLISKHFDGRLIATVVSYSGIGSVAGSSSRGAIPAVKTMLSELQGGHNIAITPDGPRGPVYEAKIGAARLALETHVPVYPLAFSCNRSWKFRSWDKGFLPKPFSKVALFFGDPLRAFPAEKEDDFSKRIQGALTEITSQADAFFLDNSGAPAL